MNDGQQYGEFSFKVADNSSVSSRVPEVRDPRWEEMRSYNNTFALDAFHFLSLQKGF